MTKAIRTHLTFAAACIESGHITLARYALTDAMRKANASNAPKEVKGRIFAALSYTRRIKVEG
jgi:hypothetical protein